MKTIVHTLRFGPEPDWMTRCLETLESWCERMHYPLTVWSDPSVWSAYPSPKFVEKNMLEAFLASDADRLLYVDADVYVNPKSPAFPIIAGVAMATDIWHKDHTERWKQWCVDTYHDNKILGTKRDYTNAGVWSCDRESARKILSVMEGLPMVESFQDQDWWNYCVWKSGAKFSYLPSDWNRYARDYNPGWFLHLWGENKARDLQTLDDLGLLDFEPDGMTHCLHPQPWPNSDKVVVQEFIQDAGLGNQLFEFAAGYGIAKRLGLPFMWSWKPSLKREFGLTRFKFAQNYLRNNLVMQRVGQGNIKLVRLAEQRITESESRFVGISCPFQAEECFSDVAAEAREFYKLDPYPIRVPRYCTAVGMQVRRGDYIGHSRLDVVTPDYFYNAMAYLRNRIDKPHFFVVSDDPGWCMQKFGHLDDVTVMPEQTAIDGLRTLATCEAHIISNSTFGWWGAWLGEKGPVVVPEIWHQKAGSYGDWNPVPARWHKVPVRSSISRVKVTEVGEIPPRLCDRAVVYPWKSDGSVWQELRFSLRSIERFFADKECPIYILGTRRPAWLLFGEQRVRFLDAHTYSDALIRGVTLADEVLWMNDDILLLKPTMWEDCRRTLYIRDVGSEFSLNPGEQTNPWREGAIKVLKQLRDEGVTEQRVYCTHTPYVYRREEAIQTLRRFGVWEKMPFELAYFHRHAVDPLRVTDERTMTADFGNARFLNWTDNLLTPELREAIKKLLPDYAPWELVAPLRV